MIALTNVNEFRFILLVRDLGLSRSFYEKTFNWKVINDWGGGVLYDTGAAVGENSFSNSS
ncbi:hypothetical protein HYT02_04335 [Candidatus Gottesmanbacteria bacterium]|nr:hypothetical protein [Candidatus Gottesmanbacteria bacterium]